MLIVDVTEPHDRPGETFTYHLNYTPEPGDGAEEAELLAPAAVEVRVTYLNGVFVVDTVVRARYRLPCARCLEPFTYGTEVSFSEQYDLAAGAGARDAEQNVVTDDRIDLTGKVRDAVIGALPMKALCREDCPGLCMHCGVALAAGPCDCTVDEIDPRLAGLARLLKDHEKKGVE